VADCGNSCQTDKIKFYLSCEKPLFVVDYEIYLPVESAVAGAMRGGEAVCGLFAEETSEKMKDCANIAQRQKKVPGTILGSILKKCVVSGAGRLIRRTPHWVRHPA